MNVWNHLPYRVQKRLANVRSQFMKSSGTRQSRLKLVRENRALRSENRDFRTSIDEQVSSGVEAYVSEAKKAMADYAAATKSLVASAISRSAPHVSDRVKSDYVPNSFVLPIVIGALSAGDRRFRKLPLSIWYDGKDVYTSSSFSKAYSGKLDDLIESHAKELGNLSHGKAHTVKGDKFNLDIYKFEAPGLDGVNCYGACAVPNDVGKKGTAKVLRSAGSDVMTGIRGAYSKLATPEDAEGGLDYGAI